MSKYSLTILAKTADGVVERIEKIVKALDGKLAKTVEMGKRPLSYQIAKAGEAHYFDLILELPNEAVIQLRKKLTVDRELLRHILLKAK